MFFDTITKLLGFDSVPELDTARLVPIGESWQVDIVAGDPSDPLLPFKEQGVDIISEELSKQHGRMTGGAWRSTTKGRGHK